MSIKGTGLKLLLSLICKIGTPLPNARPLPGCKAIQDQLVGSGRRCVVDRADQLAVLGRLFDVLLNLSGVDTGSVAAGAYHITTELV